MPMPGGWTMSMAWMRMPGQGWARLAVAFLGMWIVMMMAMMLPVLVPMLRRYRAAVGGPGTARVGRFTIIVAAAYFLVWTGCGIVAFVLGVASTTLAMRSPDVARSIPLATAAVVSIAGALQFTRWKAHHLACCRATPGCTCTIPMDAHSAWRHGLRLGLHCCRCCAGPTAVLLVVGVMDLRAMAVVTAAITAERLAPAGGRVARAIGIAALGTGAFLLAQAVGFA
jgi:predicted metal-binding membrane protein